MPSMNDVYRKIKEISNRTPNPRPQIPTGMVAGELMEHNECIFDHLSQLKELRLIQFDITMPEHVRLTLLGHTVTRTRL